MGTKSHRSRSSATSAVPNYHRCRSDHPGAPTRPSTPILWQQPRQYEGHQWEGRDVVATRGFVHGRRSESTDFETLGGRLAGLESWISVHGINRRPNDRLRIYTDDIRRL